MKKLTSKISINQCLLITILVVYSIFFCLQANALVADNYLTGNTFVIKDVTVIDGLGSQEKPHQDIFISNGKIDAILPSGQKQPKSETKVINGTGLTAMPGLIDMHIHLKGGWTGGNVLPEKYPIKNTPSDLQQTLAAFLYAGVTTVLDVGNPTDWVVEQRDKINRGDYIGPRFFTTGMPFSQTPSGWDGAVEAETVGEPDPSELSVKVDTNDPLALSAVLEEFVQKDIKMIKLYSGISGLGATFLLKQAEKLGITTVADLWQLNMDADWMRMTGLDGWAHSSPFVVPEASNKWIAENDRFVIATANVGEKLSGLRVKEDGDKQSFYTNPLVIDIWGEQVVKDFYESYPDVREALYDGAGSFYQTYNFGDLSKFRDSFLKNIKNAHEAGVLVAGGTDAPAYPSLWSGETMHRELELFVMAGITPIDAIMMCSFNGAKILKDEDKYGSLQSGLAADILIVSGKPWKNISDSRNIEHVFFKGLLLDRKKLLTSWK